MFKKVVFILIFVSIVSCNSQPVSKAVLEKYLSTKNLFENKLVEHFPNELKLSYYLVHNENLDKNDISLILYQYNCEEAKLDSVYSFAKKALINYNSKDKCLLIINRFQTIENRDFDNQIKITDSSKINRNCYKGRYPIPSFIDYDYPDSKSEIKLSDDFDIFVLESNSGNQFERFSLNPNPQMPEDWKNGYSRGIAVSRIKKTIIYWLVIW